MEDNVKIKQKYAIETVRTRFAPSPTGFMHIGNLRTALYEYLIAKSHNGKFILRIEDTDKNRFVEDSEKVIFETLKKVNLQHDEGPDVGGNYGPYRQSERLDIYKKYAQKLIDSGKAYRCFCTKERLKSLQKEHDGEVFTNYDGKCRNLNQNEINENLKNHIPFVIRQKVPKTGKTTFQDVNFGEITVENSEIDDQILIKTDGFPTYNFANVIDDHLMKITHVVRGTEYLSSSPKYNLLYEAFGWKIPKYIHLPLILGKNDDGSTSKLSKRHGSISFLDLLSDGYLAEAIVNYIALLGWAPHDNQEFFTLDQLEKVFDIKRISKSPSVFEFDKLNWFNSEYIKKLETKDFEEKLFQFFPEIRGKFETKKIIEILRPRLIKFSEVREKLSFLIQPENYSAELFINKKSKTNIENSLKNLQISYDTLKKIENWDFETLHESLINLAKSLEIKNGTLLYPIRAALSGKIATCGGAFEILDILGKTESLKRIKFAIEKLQNSSESQV